MTGGLFIFSATTVQYKSHYWRRRSQYPNSAANTAAPAEFAGLLAAERFIGTVGIDSSLDAFPMVTGDGPKRNDGEISVHPQPMVSGFRGSVHHGPMDEAMIAGGTAEGGHATRPKVGALRLARRLWRVLLHGFGRFGRRRDLGAAIDLEAKVRGQIR